MNTDTSAAQEAVTALARTVCESFLGMWVTLLPYSYRQARYLGGAEGRMQKLSFDTYQIANRQFSPEDVIHWGAEDEEGPYVVYYADTI